MNNDIILLFYTLMCMYVIYMGYKAFQIKRMDKEVIQTFDQQKKILIYLMMVLIVWMMFLEIQLYFKIILLIIAAYFLYVTFEKIEISNLGIYHIGRLVRWENIKKWTFDEKKGTLFITDKTKKGLVPFFTRPEDRETINALIKEHKKK